MVWQQLVSGRDALQERVAQRCGSAEARFADHGHRFGDWVHQGVDASTATVAVIEREIAAYLAVAARVGKAWGTVVGLVAGAAGALVAAIVVWVLS